MTNNCGFPPPIHMIHTGCRFSSSPATLRPASIQCKRKNKKIRIYHIYSIWMIARSMELWFLRAHSNRIISVWLPLVILLSFTRAARIQSLQFGLCARERAPILCLCVCVCFWQHVQLLRWAIGRWSGSKLSSVKSSNLLLLLLLLLKLCVRRAIRKIGIFLYLLNSLQ